uniref:Peptidase S1 domain-containing protein n=2 Tax=Caenorhabditis japonica TaxID=281687 RepID=A0A8R1HWF9_CAEJA
MENVTVTEKMTTVSSTMCSGTVISSRHILTSTHCFALSDTKDEWSGLINGVFERKKCEKEYAPRYQCPTVKHGGGIVMVWGCFSDTSMGPLKRTVGTMDRYVYEDILENTMRPWARANLGRSHYHITDPYILGNTYIMGDDVEQLDKYPEKVTLVNGCMSKKLRKKMAMIQIDDFAIIHLSKELSFSDRVQQACVSTNTTDITLDKPGPKSTGVLRHETIKSGMSMRSAGMPYFFLAADPNHKTVTCPGDSGGGAVAKINQRATVVGVMSQTTCDIQGKRIGPESGEVYASVAYYSTLVCQMTGVCESGEYDKYHQGYGRKPQPATRPPVPSGPATRDSNGNIVFPAKRNGDSKESPDSFDWALVNGAMQGFSALVFQFTICILIVLG